jgi:hypothetical protein
MPWRVRLEGTPRRSRTWQAVVSVEWPSLSVAVAETKSSSRLAKTLAVSGAALLELAEQSSPLRQLSA